MSSSSTVYLNVKKDLKIPFVLDKVKKFLNGIVDETYLKEKVSEKEINPKMPLLRNASRIKNFLYEPIVYEDSLLSESFRAIFNVFVSSDLVGGFSSNLKTKESVDVPNQTRVVNILTNNNGDASNAGINLEDNDDYLTISIGNDIIGQKIIERLASELFESFKTEIYFKHEFSELKKVS